MLDAANTVGSRPAPVASAADFVAELRRLRAWVGRLSLRELSKIAERRRLADGGRTELLPPSTTSEVLAGKRLPRLPRLEFVESYVAGCLSAGKVDEAQIEIELAHWRELWRSLAEPSTAPACEPVAVRPRPRLSAWLVLAAVFLSGGGLGVAGTQWWNGRQPAAGSLAAAASPDACAGPDTPVPAGRDIVGPTPAWWVNDTTIPLHSAGLAFDAEVRPGTQRAGDVVIVKNVQLVQGRHYALAFTASTDRPTTVKVRAQDNEQPYYYPSIDRDFPVDANPCRHVYAFVGGKTSSHSELTFQVGGHPDPFRLAVSGVALVDQDG
ncbi:hypothetical protein [Paractinoplanes durhamensis]|uniref:XRE family transcriptional regulator n=1 Tax=Paractinoplanes durhamensis TaxID=113563 RepID=A0ABQ3ZB72_9ACTN|nr:hypothetical protein [Actinoplanes durhamensis]GIE07075.1 hypothetical protein Adu01nite_84250 [Actinoplanes durhamensis]